MDDVFNYISYVYGNINDPYRKEVVQIILVIILMTLFYITGMLGIELFTGMMIITIIRVILVIPIRCLVRCLRLLMMFSPTKETCRNSSGKGAEKAQKDECFHASDIVIVIIIYSEYIRLDSNEMKLYQKLINLRSDVDANFF